MRLGFATPYASPQSAFVDIASDGEKVMAMSGKYAFGAVTYDKSNTITLKGGYDDGTFTTHTGAFTIISDTATNGSLTIQSGTVTLENIAIQ